VLEAVMAVVAAAALAAFVLGAIMTILVVAAWAIRREDKKLTEPPFALREPKRVVPSAAALLTAAARLLPAADRARYAQEYRSELWALAHSGAGRLRQLQYVLRQFRTALPMAAALRSPRRRSATP
jgi:hypothetical protein